jgi:hypothetical protein
MSHYLFGYGSLINSASRAKTGDTGAAFPVQVRGFRRAWNVVAAGGGYTAVGLTQSSASWCNGVLIEVTAEELPKFDRREHLYDRATIPPQAVTVLSGAALPAGSIWTYLISQPGQPSETCPLIQSYIDVILTGCLAINADFAAAFVDSTAGWEQPWQQDRLQPRYQRAMTHVPAAAEIDALLQSRIPGAFEQRREQL